MPNNGGGGGFWPGMGYGGQGVIRHESEKTERELPNRLIWEGILWSGLIILLFWAIFLAYREAAIVALFVGTALVAIHVSHRAGTASWASDGAVLALALVLGWGMAVLVWQRVIDPAFAQVEHSVRWLFAPLVDLPRWFWLVPATAWAFAATQEKGKLKTVYIAGLQEV